LVSFIYFRTHNNIKIFLIFAEPIYLTSIYFIIGLSHVIFVLYRVYYGKYEGVIRSATLSSSILAFSIFCKIFLIFFSNIHYTTTSEIISNWINFFFYELFLDIVLSNLFTINEISIDAYRQDGFDRFGRRTWDVDVEYQFTDYFYVDEDDEGLCGEICRAFKYEDEGYDIIFEEIIPYGCLALFLIIFILSFFTGIISMSVFGGLCINSNVSWVPPLSNTTMNNYCGPLGRTGGIIMIVISLSIILLLVYSITKSIIQCCCPFKDDDEDNDYDFHNNKNKLYRPPVIAIYSNSLSWSAFECEIYCKNASMTDFSFTFNIILKT
jgi:hypothetical protein